MSSSTPKSAAPGDYFIDANRAKTLTDLLVGTYGVTDPILARAIAALGEATDQCAVLLSNACYHTYAGSTNTSGDSQLHLDLDCDAAVFKSVRQSRAFSIAASEETPVETTVCPDGEEDETNDLFSLGFDPLDGSSIIDANFAVGSIYGIWPGKGVLGRTGREQVASAVAIYGPRTTLCIALTSAARPGAKDGGKGVVFEVTLVEDRTKWELSKDAVTLQPAGKIFAPGNLRASNDNPRYDKLVRHWIEERYTLRYTGGMVPDVYHILVKGKGVFANVSSEKARAKLRLLYEVAPIGLVMELAGGRAIHEDRRCVDVLDIKIDDLDQRLGVCFGSSNEVDKYERFMFD